MFYELFLAFGTKSVLLTKPTQTHLRIYFTQNLFQLLNSEYFCGSIVIFTFHLLIMLFNLFVPILF
jgi:hypothetical protein